MLPHGAVVLHPRRGLPMKCVGFEQFPIWRRLINRWPWLWVR
jgi:hypothetical protein